MTVFDEVESEGSAAGRRQCSLLRVSCLVVLLGLPVVVTAQDPCEGGPSAPGCAEEPAIAPASWLDSDWDGLPGYRSESRTLSLELGGRLQVDHRHYSREAAADSGLLVRRARIRASGLLSPRLEYKVQLQFGIGAEESEIKDGYLEVKAHDRLRLQLGKFKAPFSQEELQSSKTMEFVERSLVNILAPGRALGVMAFGTDADGRFSYELAAVNRGFDGVRSPSLVEIDGPRQNELFGRVRLRLFERPVIENLELGGALGYGIPGGESSFAVETSSESFEFQEPVLLRGHTSRQNVEAKWWYKGFGVQSEAVRWSGERRGLAVDRSDLPSLGARGFMIQGLVILTGEAKSDGGIRPRRPFLRGGFGAVEIGIRYDVLEWDLGDLDNRADSWTLGVNWWLFDRVHYRVDFNWDRFRGSALRSSTGERNGFTVLSRAQIFF